MPGLGTSFGRGGATTFQQDLANADCILIMGSNMAECHPVGFQWVMEAKDRGATVIHVDPRFTRTSAQADLHVPIRAGSDIVFLGAVVNHILENGKWFDEYVRAFTNAAAIVDEAFLDTEDLDGLFSGFDPATSTYDPSSWRLVEGASDPTLQHPRCVFQVLKRHFSRYTPEMVEELCGVPATTFVRVADTLCENSGRERTTAFCYAVGWTQHTVGAQYIRTAAIIQLLLGNIGRPGGGILALRGHASIQGSTDIPTLFNLLPGYLRMPWAEGDRTFRGYLERHRAEAGLWSRLDAYLVSLLKAWWGDAAHEGNDWCFEYLPLLTGDHSTYPTTLAMLDGQVEGFFVVGENPAVGSANAKVQRLALAKLRWLVVRDLREIETATFWRDSPEIETGELSAASIATEVFFLPAAAHTEKDGTFTNTQRLLQWHDQAVAPPGDCQSELDFYYELGRVIREKLTGSTDPRDRPILDLVWDASDAEAVLREINGQDADGRLLSGFAELRADGSTACGCWIYSGCFEGGVNRTAAKAPGEWVAPDWGWAWPANRRILYNRASADPEGRPWSERKKYVWRDDATGAWTGYDQPDLDEHGGDGPFGMQVDGMGWLYVPAGLKDGPLPTHYEPHESPFENPLYAQQGNPARLEYRHRRNRTHRQGSEVFPYVMTSYRLTEHHAAGGMSRFLGVLAELQPEMFCEVSPALAAERGLEHGGWATIVTVRAAIEARVLVTERMAPLVVQGRPLHQVGLPYHWGSGGQSSGDAANDLFPMVLDPNVHIQEVKAATCDIRPGRRPRGEALTRLVEEYRRREER